MTSAKPRTHLIERAAEAMSEAAGLRPGALPPPVPPAALAPATPPTATPPAATSPAAALPATAPSVVSPTAAPAAAVPVAARPVISAESLTQAGLVVTVASGRSRQTEEVAVVFNHVLGMARGPAQRSGKDRRVILITSARPGEGKSFTALNLAGGMAIAGRQQVLLIDADGKQGSLSQMFGLGTAPGLQELAGDPARRPATLVVPTVHETLSVMPYGATPREPLMSSASMVSVVQAIAAALPHHVIVIDAPPCLSTSEASMLAPIVGQVIMVVEAEKTQKSEVEAALDMVEACPTLQLLLNQSRFSSRSTFGSYGYETYGNTSSKA